MSADLPVADINSYLAATGWTRRPEDWRGAAVWEHEGDHEILVPGEDGLADGPRRVREILALLAAVEGRSRADIAADIGAPMADVQWYRAPIVAAGGRFGLSDAVTALTSAKEALGAAARAALSGPRPASGPSKDVRDLLARVWIEPSGDLLTVRVPLERDNSGEPPLARRTLIMLQRTAAQLRDAGAEAHRTGDISVFDGVVRDGVSADLCAALARFAGSDEGSRFEVGFRWARGLPSGVPASRVVFEAETGRLLKRVAHRFRRLHRESASVTGRIATLFDDGRADRFRVQVHGAVSGGGARRPIWVRLPGEAAYDVAVEAHRNSTTVRADGTLMQVNGRLELAATSFTTVTHDRSEEI
ncbi:hypothetical protein GBF35_04415 [Nonomuraea phyllanthi]|nr:hypothetical protein GBF35_04415 [Nonomuraea phyllanthi]